MIEVLPSLPAVYLAGVAGAFCSAFVYRSRRTDWGSMSPEEAVKLGALDASRVVGWPVFVLIPW